MDKIAEIREAVTEFMIGTCEVIEQEHPVFSKEVRKLLEENRKLREERDELQGHIGELDNENRLQAARNKRLETENKAAQQEIERLKHKKDDDPTECEDCGTTWKMGDPTVEVEYTEIKCVCEDCFHKG